MRGVPSTLAAYRSALADLAAARQEHDSLKEGGRVPVELLPLLEAARANLEKARQAVAQARRKVIESAWSSGRLVATPTGLVPLKDAHPLGGAVESLLREAAGEAHV